MTGVCVYIQSVNSYNRARTNDPYLCRRNHHRHGPYTGRCIPSPPFFFCPSAYVGSPSVAHYRTATGFYGRRISMDPAWKKDSRKGDGEYAGISYQGGGDGTPVRGGYRGDRGQWPGYKNLRKAVPLMRTARGAHHSRVEWDAIIFYLSTA